MPPLMITIIIIVVIIIIIVVMHRSPSIVLMPQSRWGFQVTYVHNLKDREIKPTLATY